MLLVRARLIVKLSVALIAALVASISIAQETIADPDPARFNDTIQGFVLHDTKNSFPENGILFVGSSSVRFWATAEAFPGKPIINRGFGGSHMSDLLHYYDQVVKPYGASKIFVYEGDNDIARGKSAEQVFEDFKAFFERAQADLPDTQILILAIKPSNSRWKLWPTMDATNKLIKDYTDKHTNLSFVDVATPLLDGNGKPKDVFIADGLHLNSAGYELWREAVRPYLD